MILNGEDEHISIDRQTFDRYHNYAWSVKPLLNEREGRSIDRDASGAASSTHLEDSAGIGSRVESLPVDMAAG